MKLIDWIKLNRLKVVLIIFCAAIITLLHVDNTIAINSLLIKIQAQKNEIHEIEAQNQLLQTQIIKLESTERIIQIAEEKLGMTKPEGVPTVIYSEEE